MRDYDLTKAADKQAFEAWIVSVVRNEINSYVKQVLFDRNAAYVDTSGMSTADRVTRLEQAIFRR